MMGCRMAPGGGDLSGYAARVDELLSDLKGQNGKADTDSAGNYTKNRRDVLRDRKNGTAIPVYTPVEVGRNCCEDGICISKYPISSWEGSEAFPAPGKLFIVFHIRVML